MPGRDRLLELGAGHCEIARVLRDRGWKVHAADIQDTLVTEAVGHGFPATRMEGEHFRFCVKGQLESVLAAKGFQVMACNSSGHLPLMDGR